MGRRRILRVQMQCAFWSGDGGDGGEIFGSTLGFEKLGGSGEEDNAASGRTRRPEVHRRATFRT